MTFITGGHRDRHAQMAKPVGDVIHLAERLRALFGDDDLTHEGFLLEEGLELLAAYRSIEDADVRNSLLQLIKAMAKSLARKSG